MIPLTSPTVDDKDLVYWWGWQGFLVERKFILDRREMKLALS
jgi:hypothetical protein